jgi:phosphomannomutase
MINFSVLGRDCPYQERERYSAWDKVVNEREKIASELQKEFPQYEISVGGSISMDITPQGCGKGQIAKHLRNQYPDEKIIFFGDKTFEGGNDFELAQALRKIENTQVVQVDGPQEVLAYLQNNV